MKFISKCVTIGFLSSSLLAACSSGESNLGVDSKYLDGLDPAVVEEVAENDYYSNHIRNWREPEVAYQGVVMEVQYCREVYSLYEEWKQTGVEPVVPDYPEPDLYFETDMVWPEPDEDLRDRIDSDGIDGVVDFMTGQMGCGQMVPLMPGDEDGPTIQEHVLSEAQ